MSFKVVLVRETQEIEPVPTEWEENGILYWPPDEKTRRFLQSNKNSCPDKELWKQYHCLVKSKNILIYGDASEEAKWFLDNTEDESTSGGIKRTKNPARRLPKNKAQKKYHFDHLLPHNPVAMPRAQVQQKIEEASQLQRIISAASQPTNTGGQFQKLLPLNTAATQSTNTGGQFQTLLPLNTCVDVTAGQFKTNNFVVVSAADGFQQILRYAQSPNTTLENSSDNDQDQENISPNKQNENAYPDEGQENLENQQFLDDSENQQIFDDPEQNTNFPDLEEYFCELELYCFDFFFVELPVS